MNNNTTVNALFYALAAKPANAPVDTHYVVRAHAVAREAELLPRTAPNRPGLFLEAATHLVRGAELGLETLRTVADWAIKADEPELALSVVGRAVKIKTDLPVADGVMESIHKIGDKARARLAEIAPALCTKDL